jgi:glycosyltransferase involved in cell wall biosynthesis
MSYCLDLSAAVDEPAGLGRYAAGLAQALLQQSVPLTAFVNNVGESHVDSNSHLVRPALRVLPTLTARLPLRRWRLRVAMSYFGAPGVDSIFQGVRLFHATAHLLPKFKSIPSVFTLHDTAYVHFPHYFRPRDGFYLRHMMPRFLAWADRIIVPSENTRRDALHYYRMDPEKIEVIPEGVEERFNPDVERVRVSTVRERYALPKRFILCINTIEPRKNLPTLLEAYAALRPRYPEIGLVIAGAKGWLYEHFFERLRSLELEHRVRLTGYVPDEDLPALLNAAEVFAYPSEFEGFGLPPLEAMACGVPVLCSNTSSFPEVVGDAGLLLPPHDVRAWVEALSRILESPQLRSELRVRGLARARLFTWERAARKTLELYRSVSRVDGER